MYFDDDDDYSFGTDNYVSPLSGQSIYVPGSTHNHWTEDCIPEGVTIDLPDGYRLDTEYNDDGEEVNTIRGGFTYDDNGDETSEFSAGFNLKFNVSITNRDDLLKKSKNKDKLDPGLMLHEIADEVVPQVSENIGKATRYDVTDSYPATTIISCYKPFSLFGATIETFIILLLVEIDEEEILTINTLYQKNDDLSVEPFFKHFLTLMKSIKANNKKIQLGSITPSQLKRRMMLEADENTEAMTLNASINIDIDNGDSKTRTTLNSDGSTTETVLEASLKYAFPDEKLYPHYNSMLGAGGLGMLGLNVVVNSTGTEYCFYQIDDYVSDETSDKVKDAVSKLNDTKASSYKLADKAVEMRGLFHVSKAAFDDKHDRECELAENYMHRAYMMSALRSFAWTLAAYCDDMSIKPKDVDLEHIHKIINFIKDNNWLNYNDTDYCKGLCSTQDLHVFYLPDKTPKSVKDVFMPDKKTLDDTKKMQEKFPSYNPILEQVGSLDKLRDDLDYIYPAVEKIFNELCENRNVDEPLEGDDADILYAWCAVAYAARGPFFSEDGPANCWYTQIESDFDLTKHRGKSSPSKKASSKSKAASKSGKTDYSNLPVAEVPDNRKKLINGNKKEKYPVRFFYYFETGGNWEERKSILYYHCEKAKPGFRGATEKLYQKAVGFLDSFDDETKAELQDGLLRSTKSIHALRSYIWTAVEASGLKDKQTIGEISKDDIIKLLSFIAKHGFANYKPVSGSSQRFGGMFLRKEEVKASCSTTGGRCNMDFVDGFDNAYSKSSGMNLVDLSYDLEALLPSMEEIASILSEDCSDDVKKAAEAVLQGWCIYALHCRASFFIMPAKYAPDIKNRADIHETIKAAINPVYMDENRYTVIDDTVVDMNDNRSKIIVPEGVKYINADRSITELLGRATGVIFPESFEGDILIPANIKKLTVKSNAEKLRVDAHNSWGEENALSEVQFTGNIKVLYGGFSWCKHLEKVMLPDTLESLPSYMFAGCEALRNIELPPHLKEIETNAFYGTNIKTLTLPPTVETIGTQAFNEFNTDLTIKVYKGTKSEKAFQQYYEKAVTNCKKLNKEYGGNDRICIHIVKLDAPWEKTAKDFVEKIEKLYDAPYEQEKMIADIGNMIDSAFDMEFDQVKDSVINKAEEKNLTTLCNVLKECGNMSMLKEKLPDILASEIPVEAKKRAYLKKHAKLEAEIKSTKDRVEVLEKSVSDYNSTMSELQSELAEKEENLQNLHNQYDALIEEKTKSWQAMSTELQEEIDDSKIYIEKLYEQIKLKNNELSGLSFLQFGKKKELTQIIEGLNKEIENEKVNRDDLVNKRNKADKDYHTAINGPKNKISAISAELANLKITIDPLSDKIAREIQELEEKKAILPELEKELEELEKEN